MGRYRTREEHDEPTAGLKGALAEAKQSLPRREEWRHGVFAATAVALELVTRGLPGMCFSFCIHEVKQSAASEGGLKPLNTSTVIFVFSEYFVIARFHDNRLASFCQFGYSLLKHA